MHCHKTISNKNDKKPQIILNYNVPKRTVRTVVKICGYIHFQSKTQVLANGCVLQYTRYLRVQSIQPMDLNQPWLLWKQTH